MSSNDSSVKDKNKETIINSSDNSMNKDEKPKEKEKEEEKEDKSDNKDVENFPSFIQDPKFHDDIKSIISAFFNYQVDSLKEVEKIENDFKQIGEKYTKRLSFNYMDRIEKFKQAIAKNYSFLVKIVSPYVGLFKLHKCKDGETYLERLTVQPKDNIAIKSNLRLFVKDWSIEGIEERNETYKPILNSIQSFFKDKTKDDFKEGIKVLVPGSGLGRLLYEIAKLGFKVEGNELSFNMLLFYSFLFNSNVKKNEITIQPFIHSLNNLFNFDTAFKEIMIPDENIKEELAKNDTGEIYMMGGDFCYVYKKKPNCFDSVVTCFFIDTASNVIEYIETIYNTLKEGGLWINIGPLLYHHTNIPNDINIQLGWNEIKDVIIGFGFDLTKEEIIETTYSTDKDSMLKTVYKCIFFTAVKKK